jgi:U2-associated protein SR140
MDLTPGFPVKLSWGKELSPFPKMPFYVHHESKEGMKMKTDLPFNAKPSQVVGIGMSNSLLPQMPGEFCIPTATVMVVIPLERAVRQLIHRTIEFVVREGPEFEALLMRTYADNLKFAFLSEFNSHDHVYYRWKLFSILHGDRSTGSWKKDKFYMFAGGSVWVPPEDDQIEKLEEVEKGHLSNSDRDTLEDHLRNLTAERKLIGKAMVWCLKHADAAEEVVECIAESLSILGTPIGTKIARLFLVSDILHNCSGSKVRNASYYRNKVEVKLPAIFKALHEAYNAISGRMRQEKFRQDVRNCLQVWQEWNVFPPNVLMDMESIFQYGGADAAPASRVSGIGTIDRAGANSSNSVLIKFRQDAGSRDGTHTGGGGAAVVAAAAAAGGGGGASDGEEDDVDGVPLDDDEALDVDGIPMDAAPSAAGGVGGGGPVGGGVGGGGAAGVKRSKWEMDEDEDDDDVDGQPLDVGHTLQPKLTLTKWERMEMEAEEKRQRTTR